MLTHIDGKPTDTYRDDVWDRIMRALIDAGLKVDAFDSANTIAVIDPATGLDLFHVQDLR